MQLDNSFAAIVTGGASGLGEATAQALAARGVKVALFDFNEETGTRVANAIGGTFCNVDVTSEDSVVAGFASAREAQGQERILVNCAGTGNVIKTVSRDRETGAIKPFPTDQFDRIIQINLVGTFRCCAQSAAGMLTLEPLADGARGVIINTSSAAAIDGQIGQAAYSASKGGVMALTLPMARDLMGEGIRVNAILPGIFDTPLMARASDKVRESLSATVPFPKRFGKPAEFAAMALAMIENDYCNGEYLRLDGGLRMPPR